MKAKMRRVVFAAFAISISASGDLPKCVESENAISESELFARLAYAETLASNCPEENSRIAPVVVGVIRNRIKARKGDAASVVFEKNQFASSLHKYKESRRKDFLCPRDSKLWELISSEIHAKNQSSLPSNAFHYYFFKHSERFQPPPWAKGPKSFTPVVLDISEGERPCVRAYVNSSWK